MAEELSNAIGVDILYEWDHSKMVQVKLNHPDDFLKIKETLTRIGVGNRESSVLTQTCHILHQGGSYFICHFKELFRLEGRESNITINDMGRRNTIIDLLEEWKLLEVISPDQITRRVNLSQICIVQHCDKDKWKFVSKHRLGSKKK